MGFFDALKSPSARSTADSGDPEDEGPDKYQVVARDHQNRAYQLPDEIESREWVFEGEHPTKEQFEFEYGNLLEGGISYTLVAQDARGRPDFDQIQWTIEQDAIRQDDDISRLERKLDDMREEPGMAADQPFEDQVLGAILRGQVDIGTAMQLAEVKKAFNPQSHGDKQDYFQSADLSNKGEVATAAIMNMMSEYDSVGDAVQDVMGGAMNGAMSVGPAATMDQQPAQQPQQPPQQAPQQATADGGNQRPPADPERADSPDATDSPAPLVSPMQQRVEERRKQADQPREFTASDGPSIARGESVEVVEDGDQPESDAESDESPIPDPWTPSELANLSDDDLDRLAADHGINTEQIDRATVQTRLERELFGTDDATDATEAAESVPDENADEDGDEDALDDDADAAEEVQA